MRNSQNFRYEAENSNDSGGSGDVMLVDSGNDSGESDDGGMVLVIQ